MMKKLFITVVLLFSFALTLYSQEVRRVAILETVDKYNKVSYGVKFQLRAFITDAVNNTPGYEGYDRVDMSQISKEQEFQRTGMVSDADIKKLGEMTGASSIVVAEAADYDSEDRIVIAAKIINIESGRIENTTKPKVASPKDNSMEDACNELISELLGKSRKAKRELEPTKKDKDEKNQIEDTESGNVEQKQLAANNIVKNICEMYDIILLKTKMSDIEKKYGVKQKKDGDDMRIVLRDGTEFIDTKNDGYVHMITLHPATPKNLNLGDVDWTSSYYEWNKWFVSQGFKDKPFSPYYESQSLLCYITDRYEIIVMFDGGEKEKKTMFSLIVNAKE